MKKHKRHAAPKPGFKMKAVISILASLALTVAAAAILISSQTARAQHANYQLESQTEAEDTTIQYANQKITIDPATGKLRKPTAEEARAIVKTLTGLTNRSSKGLHVEHAASGMSKVDLRNRFQTVLVAKPNPDGTNEIKCVTTMQEAAEFLGLDPSKIPAKD